MKQVKLFAILFSLLFLYTVSINAQTAEPLTELDDFGNTWFLDKTAAVESARTQGKMIFFMWGSYACGRCKNVKRELSLEPLKSIADENYILWYVNYDNIPTSSPVISDYFKDYDQSPPFPFICIVDPADITIPYGRRNGDDALTGLQAFLNQYVSNELVNSDKKEGTAYISNNNLIITSPSDNEIINIYAISGNIVKNINKNKQQISLNTNSFPSSGIYIITGTSGWSQKIYVH
jgi:hypothetical protein